MDAPEITLCLDRRAILPQSDPTGRQAVISIGCALEHIMIGAAHYGIALQTHFIEANLSISSCAQEMAEEEAVVPLIRLSVGEPTVPPSGHALFDLIFSRKTNRAEYNPEIRIPSEVCDELLTCPVAPDIFLHLVTDQGRRSAIAELEAQANSFVMNSPAFSKELGSWLLPNTEPSGLGMPGATFGLSDDQALRLHRGFKGEIPLEPEDGLRFALAGKIGMEKSPLIGFITTLNESATSRIAAGQLFEQLDLILARHDFSVAVHAGIVEVPLISKMFGLSMGIAGKPLVMFRAGKPKREEDRYRPRAPRLPLKEILLNS